MTPEEKIAQWVSWIEAIAGDVQALVVQAHIFWEIQAIIENNPEIQKPSSFYTWMGATYAASAAVAIRRQADDRRGIISLARLLLDVKADARLLSRERCRKLYEEARLPSDIADHDFDTLAGEEAAYFGEDLLDEDLKKLEEASTQIERYVNERIAHYSPNHDRSTVPTFNDLDSALETIESLSIKYLRLLKLEHHETLLPTWQYDWKEIFRTPWIPESARDG